MARTYADYTGDGSNTDFAIIFDYIKTSHVAVEVNEGPAGGTNVWVRKVLGATDDYTVVTSPTNKVVFNSPPGNNVRVRVLRDSEAHIGIVDFANGSVLTETELDNSYEHNRYLAEEAEEGITGGALVKNTDGQFDADGLRLENLASPDSDDDAVTKGYADGRYVDEAGDTMTGNLAMSGNDITGVNSVQGLATPASDNHAANKEYVDDQDALQVTKTGDTMSGALTLPSSDPTSDNHAARKAYVDNATATLTNDKVSKSGDTMTGALTLPDADPTNGNHATRKTYVDAQIATTLATGVAGGPIDTVNIAAGAVETAKIENDAVTFAKMQDINSGTVIGRNIRTPADTGDPEEVPILDQDDMNSNSDTSLATQQSIKAYVDGAVGGVGGEDNVQADWNETNSTSDAFIKNKPTLATVATTGDYSDLLSTPTIPTNVSDLTNDAGYTTNAGTVVSIASGTGLTGGPITTTGTLSLASIANLRALGNVSGDSAAPTSVEIKDEDNMTSNSATSLATQQSIKAYVDSQTVSKASSGWVTTLGNSVANGATLTYTHNLGTADYTCAVYARDTSGGGNSIRIDSHASASNNYGAQVQDIATNSVQIQLGNAGLSRWASGGSATTINWNTQQIKVVVTG